MPSLFSYGTLQRDDVQLATFGRRLEGQHDELPGWEPSSVPIEDPEVVARLGHTHHANVRVSGNSESRVAGTVFEVSEAELARCDEFEIAFSYTRMLAVLVSGKHAWVYVFGER